MSEIETLASVISRMRAAPDHDKLVPNWQELVPSGSRWFPGSTGLADCPVCKGLGYVRFDLPVGHPDFGKLFVCDCAAKGQEYERSKRLLTHSGLPLSASSMEYRQLTIALRPAVTAVQEVIKRGWGWVYLWGVPGQGKTTLLMTAVAESLRRNIGAVYVTWADMLAHLRTGLFNEQRDFDARLDDWRSVTVLAIDEMGGAKSTEWTHEVERQVLDKRYESALYNKNQVTLFVSTEGPDVYSQWLTSRILDGRFQVVHLQSADLRRLM